VANGLRVHFGDKAKETIHFIQQFDNFFDIMNISNYTTHYTTRKPFKEPFRSSDDARLKV
jgi:hypothetical protein